MLRTSCVKTDKVFCGVEGIGVNSIVSIECIVEMGRLRQRVVGSLNVSPKVRTTEVIANISGGLSSLRVLNDGSVGSIGIWLSQEQIVAIIPTLSFVG